MALRRSGDEWRETHRVQLETKEYYLYRCCALSDSRALVGRYDSTCLDLFRVQSGARLERLQRVDVADAYRRFAATCDASGDDALVATSHATDQSVRVHRLRRSQTLFSSGWRLEQLARIQLRNPRNLLWLVDRLLAEEYCEETKSNTVVELAQHNWTGIERRRELIASSERINVHTWSATNDGLIIFDNNQKELLHYQWA